ncbi:2-hydroxyisoflavanone dehydratase [Ziziphus jujuba]|uniref:2-hydroxyisoflavanone dehydratase n=1 Tax=Ziziphus jujuba TaxID=326968 RepID=A0A6P4A363_ZIZJJ|nr:2-hydroxyisoflavanone dehydratase [Ziziphus jujuba]
MATRISCRYFTSINQTLHYKKSHSRPCSSLSSSTFTFLTQHHNPLVYKIHRSRSSPNSSIAQPQHSHKHKHKLLSPPPMASASKEVSTEILPYIRVYKDGTVERLLKIPTVPPSPCDPETGISSKDITVSLNPPISARLYLPDVTANQNNQKLPILIYFHGGGFCVESSSSILTHRYLNRLVSEAKVLAVSVEYRLAPENPLPIAYKDCWVALNWVASHLNRDENNGIDKDPWLISHGDFYRLYIGGDSAGANIAHNIAIRAGTERLPNDVKILGAFLCLPYFYSSKPIGSEPVEGFEKTFSYVIWNFVYPSAPGGVDNPKLNPVGAGAPSLAGLGISRLFVCVGGEDDLKDRGIWYCNAVRESGWKGELEFVEFEGENHGFNILKLDTDNSKNLIKRLASFLV